MRTRSGLDQDLNKLRDMLFEMAELVNEALDRALDSLKKRDAELAQAVIRDDDVVNRMRYEVEQYCVNTIATQQPVATDLRTIMAMMHAAVEVERMGDHATGVAKITLEVCEEPLLKPLIDLPRMVSIAREMLHEAVRALVNNDAEAARTIVKRDDEVDALHDQIFRELITYMLEDPSTIRRATHLIWASHAVERFADRATNIAERALFVTSGRLEDLTSEATEPEGSTSPAC
ncbi:MAG: phosphate signaling complex protein PhoU [Anaerolineae bacterium]